MRVGAREPIFILSPQLTRFPPSFLSSHRTGCQLGGVYYLCKVSPGAAGRIHFDATRPSKPTEVPLMLTVTQKELDDISGGRAAALMNIESATTCLTPYLAVIQNEAGQTVMVLRSKEEVEPETVATRFQNKQVGTPHASCRLLEEFVPF